MDNRRENIIRELKANQEEIINFFKELNPDQLRMTVYPEDPGWTVRQVFAHFITIERAMQRMFGDILAGGPGSPKDFDIDRYNRTQPGKLDALSLDELFDRFRSVRQDTIAIVEGMQDKDMDREGWHAFLGQGKLERFITWAYEHARLHQDDIRKILGKDLPTQRTRL